MVVAGKEDVTLEEFQVIVERLDTLHVEVVGRSVQYQAVGVAQLHTGNHTAHPFATRQHIDLLQDVLILK